MKKLIAMVMTAAMVASLVPATAFAAGDVSATAKIVDALELTKEEATDKPEISEANYSTKVPELQLKITNVDYRNTDDPDPKAEITVSLDNANWYKTNTLERLVTLTLTERNSGGTGKTGYVAANIGIDAEYLVDSLSSAGNPTTVEKIEDLGFTEKAAGQAAVKWLVDNGATFTDGTINTIITVDGATVHDGNSWQGSNNAAAVAAAIAAGKTVTGAGQLTATLATAGITTVVLDTTAVTVDEQVTFYADAEGLKPAKLDTIATAGSATGPAGGDEVKLVEIKDIEDDEVTFVFEGKFVKDDIITIDLESVLDKTGVNRQALVSVSGDLGDFDDLVYVSVLGRGITATTKKLAVIAEEEKEELAKDLVIKSTVGNFEDNQVIELRLNNGFEFSKFNTGTGYDNVTIDENVATFEVNGAGQDKITIKADDLQIEATSAKAGAVATITVKATKTDGVAKSFSATAKVEVAKVVDYVVLLSVDEDETVPTIYSGVNVANYGITDDSDHLSLEVTAEETFPGAWSMRKGFNFELPEGVYVTDVQITDADYFYQDGAIAADQEQAWLDVLWTAYRDGDHKNFEVEKRAFDDVNTELADEPASVTFQLELVADPDFVGDVTLKLKGDLVDEQEVVIAKFVAPYTVKAEQNDMKIDYRYTDVPTTITITEAEAGLWDADKAEFGLSVEKEQYIQFDGDPTFTVDSNSGLKITDEKAKDGKILFTVDKESSEAATITISNMRLFLDRTIPAGPYDLEIDTTMNAYYRAEVLFAPDQVGGSTYQDRSTYAAASDTIKSAWDGDDAYLDKTDRDTATGVKEDSYVEDVTGYDQVVHAAFVNIVTAGREQDDASFTTVVEIKIGDDIMKAGGKEISLKELKTQPAYINAKGYTMLPIRAVAVALGINTENVQWNQDTQTVIILYGQRVITMQVGSNTVYAAGTPIPATSSVEIKEGRAYLGLRDLATALGVSKIDWDGNNKIAYLNTTVAEAKAAQ